MVLIEATSSALDFMAQTDWLGRHLEQPFIQENGWRAVAAAAEVKTTGLRLASNEILRRGRTCRHQNQFAQQRQKAGRYTNTIRYLQILRVANHC